MKRIVKEDDEYLKKKLLNRAKKACQEAHAILTQAAEYVRDAVGETFLFARLDSHANDLDDTLDDITAILDGKLDAETPVDESSEGGWFDNNGWLLKPIPYECISDCSGSGRKDDQVEYWTEELGFDKGLPREKAIDWLREFGAWEVEELEGKSDTELAQIVLWEFCNELRDQANEIPEEELEEVGLPTDVEEWSPEDWTLFQTEMGMVSLNH